MTDDRDRKIEQLESELAALRKEKETLSDTVQWMHDLIWKLVKERDEQ